MALTNEIFQEHELLRKPKPRSFASKWGLTLFLMCMPAIVFVAIFNYGTIPGLLIAFKNYKVYLGMYDSPFTSLGGFQHFYDFLTDPYFWTYMKNTIVLSVTQLIIGAILPVIYALFLNEVKYKFSKRVIQTIMYAPYFISTVVMVGMLYAFFNTDFGVLAKLFAPIFGNQNYMADPNGFIVIYLVSAVWQGLGWWSIMYMGNLANVDPNLHDAARIDGAGRFRRMFSVNLPSIIPLCVIMFIMAVGNVLSVGFEKVYLMQMSTNLSTSAIISTYVYEISFSSGIGQFDYATAIGLFNMLVNIILLLVCNFISKKVSDTSLW